jgi:uncharacterized protein YlzI (FlbEa/FlbD family)
MNYAIYLSDGRKLVVDNADRDRIFAAFRNGSRSEWLVAINVVKIDGEKTGGVLINADQITSIENA